jgi:ankyrin repeat protein
MIRELPQLLREEQLQQHVYMHANNLPKQSDVLLVFLSSGTLEHINTYIEAGAAIETRHIYAAAQRAARQHQHQQATAPGSHSILEQLILAAGTVDVQDSEGSTALELAAFLRDPEAVKLLLAAGAGTASICCSLGEAAQQAVVAVEWEADLPHPRYLEQLTLLTAAAARAGCSNSIPDYHECTSLQLACWSAERNCAAAAATVGILLDHGGCQCQSEILHSSAAGCALRQRSVFRAPHQWLGE